MRPFNERRRFEETGGLIPRGYRLNNPGNIRIGPSAWRGKITPSLDHAFETFEHHVWGLRAVAKILLAYARKYDIATIEGVIGRYAPPEENDTSAYARHVAAVLQIMPGGYIDIEDPFTLRRMVMGIVAHEVGSAPPLSLPAFWYPDHDYRAAVALALGSVPADVQHVIEELENHEQ